MFRFEIEIPTHVLKLHVSTELSAGNVFYGETSFTQAELQGYLAHQRTAFPEDPTVEPCLGPYGARKGGCGFL